jgi:hypothetical protein
MGGSLCARGCRTQARQPASTMDRRRQVQQMTEATGTITAVVSAAITFQIAREAVSPRLSQRT